MLNLLCALALTTQGLPSRQGEFLPQPAPRSAPRASGSTQGVYTDGAGEKHLWRVAENHTLLWDGKPFVPVGGLFQVKSWAPTATPADFTEDVAALQRLKAAGITDIYLQPLKGGITLVKAAALQRVLDAAEAEGFTYGISLADAPRTPLLGYQILPGRYLQDAPSSGGLVRFPVKGLSSALWFLADPGSKQILDSGKADIVAEGARVGLSFKEGRNRVVIYPERLFLPGGELGLPNVWEGFDKYRDDLLTLFGQVKLGKGFRFFSDPLSLALSLTGESQQIVPSGTAFQSEWALYLSHRYATIASLEEKWGVSERGTLKDFTEATQLIPLWWAEKGLPQFFHKGTQTVVPARDTASRFWQDLEDFKTESLRGYMGQLAIALKRGVAEVPIVYRSRGFSPLFARVGPQAGFDGIGVEAYGKGIEPISYTGAETYAQVTDAQRPLWLPVLATQEARLPETTQPGFANKRLLFSMLDALRDTGARGFYVDGARMAEPTRQAYDLSQQPEQLAWLTDYAKQLGVLGIASVPQPRANAVFYPRAHKPLQPRALQDGSWWLPADRDYVLYDFGSAGSAYSLSEPEGPVFYLWNPTGPRQIKLKIPKQSSLPGVAPLAWLPAERGIRTKDILTLTIGPEPLRLYNYASLPLPQEAFPETITRAESLLQALLKRKLTEATLYSIQLKNLKQRYKTEITTTAYNALRDLQTLVAQMSSLLRPYLWVETEAIGGHNFDRVEDRPGASGGQVLTSSARPLDAAPALATFPISINTENSLRLYIAASPRASFRVQLDGQPFGGTDSPVPQPFGETFALGSLIWYDCGMVVMPRGQHQLEVRTEGAITLDALLLTPPGFAPNGSIPPPFQP